MKLLRLTFDKSLTKTGLVSFEFNPAYNECKLPLDISSNFFVKLLSDLLFSEPGSNINSVDAKLELELFQQKHEIDLVHRDKEIVSSSIIKNKEVFEKLIVCTLDEFINKEQQNWERSPQGKRLKELRVELEAYYKIDELSRTLDETHSNIFEVQEKLRKFKNPLEKKKALELEYADYKVMESVNLTDQTLLDLKNYERLQDKYQEESYELDQRIEQIGSEIDMSPNNPWFLQKEAMIGAGGSIFGFFATSFFRSNVWAFYVGLLLSILPLLLIIYAVIKANQQEYKLGKLKVLQREYEQKRNALLKKRDLESSQIHKIFEIVKTQDCSEIIDMWAKKNEIASELAALEKELHHLSKNGSSEQLIAILKGLEEKSRKIERDLSALPPMTSDYHSIQIEVENLEKLMGVDPVSMVSTTHVSKSEIIDRMFDLTALAVSVDKEKVVPVALKGIEKNIVSMTNSSIRSMVKSENDWVYQSGTKFLPLGEYNEVQQQAIAFSVQYTLWQMIAHRFQSFFILDITKAKHPGLRQIMTNAAKHLSQKTQVIVLDQ